MNKYTTKSKEIYKKFKKQFHKYINGTKGVISIFLAILMVPFATIAGYLVNAARINSAVAIFDEALCNASNSTLGTYDDFLRKRFGLLAMSQETSSHGNGYTVQDLLSETFEFYMEESLGALNNTYTSFDISVTGVYPLADTDILLSQVLEASKYSVPTKLVIEGLSIDNLLNTLTSSLNMVSQIFNTISAGTDAVDKFLACEEKINALPEIINKSESAKDEYDSAYADFAAAVEGYNDLVDEFIQKLSDKQDAIDTAQNKVNSCQGTFDYEKEKNSEILQAIKDMENEKDADGNSVDNTEKIKDYKEEHKDELAAYNNALDALNTANSELSSANNEMQSLIASYTEAFSTKRNAVTSTKSTYIDKIDAFASALKDTGNAVIDAQKKITDVASAGTSLASNFVSTVYECQKGSVDKQISDMKDSKKAAEERGDDTAKYLWQDQIDEANEKKTELNNESKLVKTYYSTESSAMKDLDSFASMEYQKEYEEAYNKLIALSSSVNAYVISTDNTTSIASATSYYEAISDILTSGEVENLAKNLASEIEKSSFIAVVKAIAGFIKAIFTLTIWYDPELCATIDTKLDSYYYSIGGLPSSKDRSDGSQYSLKSQYDEVDHQKSDYYKQLLGAYSNNPAVVGSVTAGLNIIESIMNNVDTIIDTCSSGWSWNNVFSKIGKIITAIGGVISNVLDFAENALNIITNSVTQKALLTGYIAYNVPNRTTYKGSSLTGKSYSLPNVFSTNQGYAFYGAETEYIIHGSLSEKENQTSLFNMIYILRFVFDIAGIATNTEVATLAGEAGAATFGVGTFVVYVLYLIAEPFVDTLILVNSGEIPIIKTKVYLTPSGINDLISAFYKLKLTDAQKNVAYQNIIKVASLGQASEQFASSYADAVSSGIKDPNIPSGENAFTKSWKFDYTKTIIILMMLFSNTDTLVSRLADVIQMECSYNAINRIDGYNFNLDESYTYIRAAGKFTTNEFIKISNGTGLNSKERLIYRGY